MRNEPGGSYEGEEEGEYHFSDEEVGYDTEDSAKQTAPVAAAPVSSVSEGAGALGGLSKSKRMAISFAVFAALVFVAYKVVSPTAQTGAVDENFVPPPVAQAVTPAEPGISGPAGTRESTPSSSSPVVAAQSATSPTGLVQSPSAGTPQVAQSQYVEPVQLSQPKPASPVLPVRSPAPATSGDTRYTRQDYQQQYVKPAGGEAQYDVPGSDKAAAQMASIVAENEKLMGQLQTQYMQKIQDYQTENRELQNQVQSLNSKVAMMEGRMSELLDSFKREPSRTGAASVERDGSAKATDKAPEPKIKYNVQAIIPGRAWLKSDAGETITVAEGDTLEGVGRVIKIDPYDGVVEVSSGNQVISLTYGMGG